MESQLFHIAVTTLETCGVLIILIGAGASAVTYFYKLKADPGRAYSAFRGILGQSILLGLEFLVGADIIGTVTTEPTFQSLGLLGIVIGFRMLLSFTLEVELKGRWPWQESSRKS